MLQVLWAKWSHKYSTLPLWLRKTNWSLWSSEYLLAKTSGGEMLGFDLQAQAMSS